MRNKLYILCLLFSLFTVDLYSDSVVFQEDFSSWVTASGSTLVQSVETEYGTVLYNNLAVYNQSKTYASVSKTGYIDFRAGSSTISSSNSFIELPYCTFINGGKITIIYGAGSTSKKIQLQEWNGSSWETGSYAEAATTKSSTWQTQVWQISGSGSKKFRLVQTSSPYILVSNIQMTTVEPEILPLVVDTVDFGSVKVSSLPVIKSFVVEGKNLSSSVSVDVSSPFSVSSSPLGPFYSSTDVVSGDSVYIKFSSSSVSSFYDNCTLSSSGATSLIVPVKGVSSLYSSDKQIKSFKLDRFIATINESAKEVLLELPWSYNLPFYFTPTLSISDFSTLLSVGPILIDDSQNSNIEIMAEDGSVVTYSLIVSKASITKECYISEFSLLGKQALINDNQITVNMPVGTDLSALKARIISTGNSKLKATDNVERDFSSPQTYKVEAEDGVSCFIYTVTVNLVDDVYRGPYPYISDMSQVYADPAWISGGGELGKPAYQPNITVEGDCKSNIGTYRLSKLATLGSHMEFKVSACGTFKVGVSSDGSRQIVLSNNINDVKDTIKMSSYECTYGQIEVNSNVETVLNVDVLKGSGGTNLFSIEITEPILTNIRSVSKEDVKFFSNNSCIRFSSSIGLAYSVYNLLGVKLVSSKTNAVMTNVYVDSGIYIINIDNVSYKINVR